MGVAQIWAEKGIRASERLEGTDQLPRFAKLVKLVSRQGITIYAADLSQPEYAHISQGEYLYGVFFYEVRTLFLNVTQSTNSAFATLLHEFGHALQPRTLKTEAETQVWAEGFAQLVAQQLGFDSYAASMSYLARFPKALWVLQYYAKDLDALARKVAEGLE